MLESQLKICTLCALDLPSFPILDGVNAFCCAGCQAVFNILSSKNQLSDFETNPIFQQALKAGLISNPALMEQIRRNRPEMVDSEMEKLHLEISDMWCPSCAEVIRLILLQQKGIKNCVVDYSTDLASIEFSPRFISKEEIYKLINSIGYHASSLENREERKVSFELYLRFIIAAFCSLNIMMFAYPLYATYFHYDGEGYGRIFAWLSFYTSLPVLGYSAWPIFRRFWTSMKVGIIAMEALVVLGVSTAFCLSCYELLAGGTRVYFDSMTVIIVFVLLGKIIETKAKFSAKNSLLHLSKAIPRKGRVRFTDGSYRFVPLKEINSGDIIVAFTGEKIVLDGVIIEGEGLCNESLMTGEALPVNKKSGSLVLGGSILQQGWIAYKASSSMEGSALTKILEMIEKDIGYKSIYIRSVDKIAYWFAPLVILISFTTLALCLIFDISDPGKNSMQTAIIRAISVLLISCPCAIGIAAPLAESNLMSRLVSLGAIVRNRGCLNLLGRETALVFDKTGTITEGCFTILDGLQNIPDELLGILKEMALHSNHPIAYAIAKSIEVPTKQLIRKEEIAGKGLRGFCDRNRYYLGSADFLREQGIVINLEEKPVLDAVSSEVYFAQNEKCIAQISLGDLIKKGAKELIESLSKDSIRKTILLSGDSQKTVGQVANLCSFSNWKAGCTPLQKRDYIDSLRKEGEIVCMIGDGINDAPALTAANIGISVVSATDISIQVSDILLTTDRLEVISKIRKLALKGRSIVIQNIFWAFFYNVIGIGMATFGLLSPIFAALAMVLSSLMVLFNAKRLKL